MGVAPGELTLRELVWMVEANRHESWQHTSAVLATLANIHRDPKKKPKPFTPKDFQPQRPTEARQEVVKADIQVLKRVFVDRAQN